MMSAPTTDKSRVNVDAELLEEPTPKEASRRRTRTAKKVKRRGNETALKLREDAALLKSMLVEDKEKRSLSSKSRKPRDTIQTSTKLTSIVEETPAAKAQIEPMLLGPYEDDEEEPKRRRKKKKSRVEDKIENKKVFKKASTKPSKKDEKEAVDELSRPYRTRQSKKKKRGTKNEPRHEDFMSSTFYASQQGRLQPQSDEQPAVESRRSFGSGLRQSSHGDSEISDLTSDSKAFEKAMQAIEQRRQSIDDGDGVPAAKKRLRPSSIGSKKTRVSNISSDVSRDAEAFEIAKQTVVDSNKPTQLSGAAAVWAQFDKFLSMGEGGEPSWAMNEDFKWEAFDDGLLTQPKSNSISDLDKWEPFGALSDDTEQVHTITSSEEDKQLIEKWQVLYENGYSRETQILVDEMLDAKNRESVGTAPTESESDEIVMNIGTLAPTEAHPRSRDGHGDDRRGESSSRQRASRALTAPQSSFRQQNGNLERENDPSHELLVRYIQSLGTDPQVARNVARSFAQSQVELDANDARGRNTVPSNDSIFGNTRVNEDHSDQNALPSGLVSPRREMPRTAVVGDTVNAPHSGTRRHRIFWPRFETPGAVQMHTRAFGAPIREAQAPNRDIEEGSTSQESTPSTVVLEARAVSDNDTESRGTRSSMPPVVYAEKLSFASWMRHHRYFRCMILILVLAIAAVLASVLAVRLARDDSPSGPGDSPTTAPTFISRNYIQELESVSGYEALSLQGSPQRRAVGWLSSIDQSDMEATDAGLLQRYILVVLYFATGGEQWIERENWLSASLHECQWSSAISCKTDPSNRQIVTGLDLSRHGLTGELPPEIGYLSQVENFIAAKNALNGTLPQSTFNMTRLAVFDVHSNALEGSIPGTISNAPFIVDLDLSKNLFSGTIPEALYDLSILRTLDVSVNQLTGVLASGLGKLRVLTKFNIRSNLITGIIPDTFDLLTNLGVVNLDNNLLTGNIPEWTAVLVQRQELTVSYNLLTGTIPGAPEGGLAALGGVTPESFRLSKVDISNNRLRGTIPVEVAFIPSLRYIDFSNNRQLRGPFPSFPGIGLWQSIEYLAAANCQLTGTVPSAFAPTLTHYIFHGNQLRGGFPLALCELPELEYLSLAFNDIGGQIPAPVGTMERLEALDLRACGLTGTIPNLATMTSLASIDLAENSLGGSIMSEIGMLRSLTEFIAHSNQLTGQIPTEIGSLTNLVIFDIRENTMTGGLPSEIGNLVDLDQFLVANNYFQGSVPESLCYLVDDLRSVDVGCQLDCSCCTDDADLCSTSSKAPLKNETIMR